MSLLLFDCLVLIEIRGIDLELDKAVLGFPGGSAGKESACNVGDLGSIPGLERFPGEGKATHLSIVPWRITMYCIVPGVAKSWT